MKKTYLLSLFAVVLMSCGPKQMEPVPVAPVEEKAPAEDVQPAAAPVEIGDDAEGLVVFLSGDVFLVREGEESYLNIGDSVAQSDVIRTEEDGYCEIQLGNIAVVRMDSNSLLQIQTLVNSSEGSRTGVELESGTVLCKVKKLLDDDSFQVKTNTVVCGVRGTQFSVSTDQQEDILLAVKEGSVAVTPRSLDRVSELAVEEAALAPLAAKIEAAAVVVSASEELKVEKETFKEAEQLTEVVAAVVQKVEAKKQAQAVLLEEDSEAGQEELAQLVQEVEKEVEVLLVSLDKAPEAIAPEVLEVKEISEEAAEVLKATDGMDVIVLAAAAAGKEEKAPSLFRVQVSAVPAEAQIIQNGRILGTGRFEKLYTEGTELNLEVSLDGYESRSLMFSVDEQNSGDFTVELEKIPLSEPVSENPADEEALLTAAPVETPDVPAEAAVISSTVSVEPGDARLVINGNPVSGVWQSEEPEGTVIKVEASRNGYEPVSRQLTLTASSSSHVIRLTPRPVEVKKALGMSAPVGVIRNRGSLYLAADSKGKLTAFDQKGTILWQHSSANSPNANSSPVEHQGRVYFSGGSELVVLNRDTGAVINTVSLPEDRSHIYGRRVVPAGDQLFMPANGELILINSSGEDVRSIPIANGSSMSPALWSGKAVIADKKGALLVIDPSDGSLLSSIPTGAVQAVAQSPAIFGDKAVFCSRKGIVAAVDLNNGSVLWERDLERTVFADVVVTDEGCFVYSTKRELFALSWSSGEDLYAPLKDITSVPGYDRGQLVVTDRAGTLKILDAGSGRIVKQLELKDSFTARPIVRDGIIVAVGSDGEFYRINMEGLVQ
ncbi:MAG: PQQ-binding-like beta-propeller repeat protein [Spirochaetales bacterium]|nr:PQQ-binding-like beta-propeller repeat protein [Spirochaetales bacterium]